MTKIPFLFELMKERKITAAKLSADTGISAGNISDWKNGRCKPSADKLYKLADYFGVSVDYLLNGSPEPAVVVSDNVLNNVNGDNNINVTLSDDEQILNMIRDLDLVQKSKVILAIDEIRKGN